MSAAAVQMEDSVEEQRHVAAMKGGSYKFFLRGKSSVAVEEDYKVWMASVGAGVCNLLFHAVHCWIPAR